MSAAFGICKADQLHGIDHPDRIDARLRERETQIVLARSRLASPPAASSVTA